jgi:hypothetical protein
MHFFIQVRRFTPNPYKNPEVDNRRNEYDDIEAENVIKKYV